MSIPFSGPYTQKTKMLLVQFEHDYEKIAKITEFPARKTSLFKSQKLFPAKHKKSPIHKIKLPQKFSATRYTNFVVTGESLLSSHPLLGVQLSKSG